MKIVNLITNEVNQNEYHFNKLTRNKIGILYVAPVNIVPDDCLACDGYVLKIIDYKKLYSVIGRHFNSGSEADDEFRVPDYNITGRFLQPNSNVGIQINAGLPNITGSWRSGIYKSEAAVTGAVQGKDYGTDHGGSGSTMETFTFDINASRSNSIYGKSSTVQPNSQTVHICIKYK